MALMPDAKVAKFFGVCSKTIDRWEHDKALGFPPRIEINGRYFRDTDAMDAFVKSRLKKSIKKERTERNKAKHRLVAASAA